MSVVMGRAPTLFHLVFCSMQKSEIDILRVLSNTGQKM